MTRTTSPQDVLERVRQLNEGRMTAVTSLIAARQSVAAAEAAKAEAVAALQRDIDAAEAGAGAAYDDAVKAGWTDAELRAVGLPALAKPRAKRTRKPAGQKVSGGGAAVGLQAALIEREAEASVVLDRDETHVVGESVGAG